MTLRSIVLLAALALHSHGHAEVVSKVAKVRDLISQGHAHQQAGKVNDALASYREAAKADPTASESLSYTAMLFFHASKNTDPKNVEEYRGQAEAHARAALKVDERDPNATEVLRLLADGVEQKRRDPLPAAFEAVKAGEILFSQRKYTEAAVKYEEAIRLDPAYADAVVYLGDCYYMQGDMARAEQKFRQGAVIDPLYGAAWRYLYDALMKQDKRKEAEAAAFGALASMPSSMANWARVVETMDLAGRPLTRFVWQPRASAKGTKITIDQTAPESDRVAWMAYALTLAAAETEKSAAPPFARRLATLTNMFTILGETGSAEKISDQGLRDMIKFHKGGQLKAAIFALHYKEAYRDEFEAWKKAEPDGLKRFVDTFRVGL